MTILEAFKSGKFTLSYQGKVVYNATDAPDHPRGVTAKHAKPTLHRVYSVHRITDRGMAHCESLDIFYRKYEDILPAETLIPWSEKK